MEENQNVIIIGAGVAGLAAGTYLHRSGFRVTILEQHTIPGGLSTSWSRKGYLFEGGMHWLTGSSPALTLNRVWHETGALKDNNPVFNKDPFYTLIHGDRTVSLYRDADRLEQHLLAFAPEDAKAIRRMCRDIRIFRNVHMPVGDIGGLRTKHHTQPSLKELAAMAPAALRLGTLMKQSYTDYVARFKNEDIRHLLLTVIGTRYNALSFVYTLGSFASGDCGYPEGGSIRMTQNMADTFTALGGTISFRTKVQAVSYENGRVTGVTAGVVFYPSRRVIVTQDTRQAIDSLFTPPLGEPWARKMRRDVVSEQNMFVCLGVKADLSKYPRGLVVPLSSPFEAGGLSFGELRINNYAQYEKHAPEGCTALTCLLLGPSYAWWKARKADGTYKAAKDDIIRRFIAAVQEFIPEIRDSVEVIDMATPCTYERYCGSFEGSWMSVWEPGGSSFTFPGKSKSIDGLYFAGERSMMPGGLPITVWAGRRAAQLVCRDTGAEFIPPSY